MTTVSNLEELEITPGVMTAQDATQYDIPCWGWVFNCRFDPSTGRLRKLGGWISNTFNYGATIRGVTRTVYSANINQKVYTVLGTNSYLYTLIGSTLVNNTPLQTIAVAAPNSLDTHYATLAANPISTVAGSAMIDVADPEALLFEVGDSYILSGATGFNGLTGADLNSVHVVRSVAPGLIGIVLGTSANATGAGGGAAVTRSSGLITVNTVAHANINGDRVRMDGAANTGGILAGEINQQFIIRNSSANSFDIMTQGLATSAVSAGGGASAEYYEQIIPGAINASAGQGYGMGLYGAGLYGTALVSNAAQSYPRIWFVDRFGDNLLMTPGDQSPVYLYDPTSADAPLELTGAPDAVNYLFVSNNILVTFGHEAENRIEASDQNNINDFVSSSTTQAYSDNIEGAGRLVSHCPTDAGNLIFTDKQTYIFNYIGLPFIWNVQLLDQNIGIIGAMARVSVNGTAYWMGQEGFYQYRGGKVEPIPSNFGPQSSILRYVFDDLNYNQRSKCFAGYNEKYDEIWFHYPSAGSNECDRKAVYSRKLQAWAPNLMNRTAWEWPVTSLSNPRLANIDALYTHEAGNNDDSMSMQWTAQTRKVATGTKTANMAAIVPDSEMTGAITTYLQMYNYPQSAEYMANNAYNITATTESVKTQGNGRFWQLTLLGDQLDQAFLMGQWMIEPQQGARAK